MLHPLCPDFAPSLFVRRAIAFAPIFFLFSSTFFGLLDVCVLANRNGFSSSSFYFIFQSELNHRHRRRLCRVYNVNTLYTIRMHARRILWKKNLLLSFLLWNDRRWKRRAGCCLSLILVLSKKKQETGMKKTPNSIYIFCLYEWRSNFVWNESKWNGKKNIYNNRNEQWHWRSIYIQIIRRT